MKSLSQLQPAARVRQLREESQLRDRAVNGLTDLLQKIESGELVIQTTADQPADVTAETFETLETIYAALSR